MRFTYTGVRVRDIDKSIDFYTRLLGMRLIGRWRIRETGGENAALKSPDTPVALELNWYPDASQFFEPPARGTELDHLNFDCEDVDAEVERLRKEGVGVVIEPFDEGDTRLAYVEDPDGIAVQLQSPRRKAAAASAPVHAPAPAAPARVAPAGAAKRA